ncbi:UDP-N-acetylglucosamine 2-epimerase [Paenibacillus sp. 481]|nr:UDP-N-acetylglucosamine 2-epimerase [Paenibacillus sp. 481]
MPLPTQKAKVLVLTGSIGHGHLQTANAIREIAEKWFPHEADVHVVDYMEQVSPYLHEVSSYCFVQWVKLFPSMYGYLFEKTRRDRKLSQMLKSVRFSSLRPLEKLINQMQPTVIVSTFPAASAAVSKLKERGVTNCQTATIITDYTDHSFWIYPFTDLYMVGSTDAKAQLVSQGIQPSRIEVTGIPVRPAFYDDYDKQILRQRYGLDPSKMTVLLMGGGCGLLDPTLLTDLEEAEWAEDMQFVVVCGNNDKLRQRLSKWATTSALHVHVEGYIEPIHEYMAMSDLMITKSGGVTTTEALAQRLPLIVHKPLPGQERDNVRYLLRNGLARSAEHTQDLLEQLAAFAAHPEMLQRMSERALVERQQNATGALSAILRVQQQPQQAVVVKKWYRRSVV